MRISSAIVAGLRWISPRAADTVKTLWAQVRRTPLPYTKAQIINHLAEVRGYRHYLEVCTPTSGGRYAEIDRSKFATCARLMYRCPETHVPGDGMPIDYRTTDLDIGECLTQIRKEGRCFDIALLDSFHDYSSSMRDLVEGFRLIDEGGTLVVHDCLPRTADVAQPQFVPGFWCGVTYQAFIDFVTNRDNIEFYTIDTDEGCGVIHKQAKRTPVVINGVRSIKRTVEDRDEVLANWLTKRDDSLVAFSFFDTNKKVLMNSISIREFVEANPKSLGDLLYNIFKKLARTDLRTGIQ